MKVPPDVIHAMDHWETQFRSEVRLALLHLAKENGSTGRIEPAFMPAAIQLACSQLAEKIPNLIKSDGRQNRVA